MSESKRKRINRLERKKQKDAKKQARQRFYQDVRYNIRNSSFKSRLRAFGKLIILLLILVGIPLFLVIFYKDTLLNSATWSNLPTILGAHRKGAFLALIFLQMLQIVVCILPGQPIQFASSYLYGVVGGLLIALIGAVIGSIITYRLANFLGNDAMHLVFGEQRVKDYIRKLNSSRSLTIVFLIYLIPGIPKDLVSYVAGISDIELKSFLLVSTAGRIPGLMGSLLVGTFWQSKNYVGLAIVAIIMLAILLLCFKYRERIMDKLGEFENKQEKKEEAHEKAIKK